jgi:glycosyltransferase involved in cell wall biosynthesis
VRVTLAVPSLAEAFGGPALKARSLARALRSCGNDVTLVGAGRSNAAGDVAVAPVARFHGSPIPLALHRVAAAARRADVLHVIGFRDPVGTVAALAAGRAGVPYLVEPAGMMRRRLRSVTLKFVFDLAVGNRVLRRARLLLATSALEAAEFEADGVPRDRIAVRPNGLDLDDLRGAPERGAFRRELGVPDGAPLVLSLGRLAAKKGLPWLVECVAGVAEAHLALVGPDDGDGTLARVLETRARFGAEGRVHVVAGGLWGRDRARAFADSDLFCLFSRTENFGTAAAEAAACGVVPVVSDQCGVAEWLGAGAVVVPLSRPEALAGELRRLCTDGAERRRLAEIARGAAEKLTWTSVAERQLAIYRSLLS